VLLPYEVGAALMFSLASLPSDGATLVCRYAYVEFVDAESVPLALQYNESELHGRQIKVGLNLIGLLSAECMTCRGRDILAL
jgi:hypothetical protein